jgi:hypothetical protein
VDAELWTCRHFCGTWRLYSSLLCLTDAWGGACYIIKGHNAVLLENERNERSGLYHCPNNDLVLLLTTTRPRNNQHASWRREAGAVRDAKNY